MLGAPDCALDDAMVTMRPQPAASMSGTAACTQVNVPVRLTAMIRSHVSGVMSSTGVERLDAGAGDEDLDRARARRGPARTAASTEPRSATSTSTASAVPPPARSSSAAASAAGPLRSRTATAVAVGDELAGDAEADARGAAGDDRDPAHRRGLDRLELEVQLA